MEVNQAMEHSHGETRDRFATTGDHQELLHTIWAKILQHGNSTNERQTTMTLEETNNKI